jgi:peptide/nickel transport system ATP-binding protein
MKSDKLLQIDGLVIEVASSGVPVVRDVNLSVGRGEIVSIVGESGSGKTLVARSLLNLEPAGIRRTAGSIIFEGQRLDKFGPAAKRMVRGSKIGMVFQEPLTSLNPSMTIGAQLQEGMILHGASDARARMKSIVEMLARIGLRDPERMMRSYPHEFSGGMRQRIMLASVMLPKPKLLIADEPTTALDAIAQRDVLELMVALSRESDTAILMISHDLPMVARYSDRIAVMEKGRIVETGQTSDILAHPQHVYTRKLLGAVPRRSPARAVPHAIVPIVSVTNLSVHYRERRRLFQSAKSKRALVDVSLKVMPGEVVAVVGGSGSGKTTLGRVIAGLIKPTDGQVRFKGRSISDRKNHRDYRLNCQMVFQDPYSSLDPRMTVGQAVREPLRSTSLDYKMKTAKVIEILSEVGLGSEFLDRYPHQLSGGQRQRVAIARALICQPSFVIADEPVSALDVTVRAQILELFVSLQRRHGFSCLFISHDLGVVEQIADRVLVMHEGEIVEQGARDQIFDAPKSSYTRRLLSAVPVLLPGEESGVRLVWRPSIPV